MLMSLPLIFYILISVLTIVFEVIQKEMVDKLVENVMSNS